MYLRNNILLYATVQIRRTRVYYVRSIRNIAVQVGNPGGQIKSIFSRFFNFFTRTESHDTSVAPTRPTRRTHRVNRKPERSPYKISHGRFHDKSIICKRVGVLCARVHLQVSMDLLAFSLDLLQIYFANSK